MILLVSNSRDFATDYVIAHLLERQLPYLRIDLDLLASETVYFDPVEPCLTLIREGRMVTLDAAKLWSVYYRAPTHLCESSGGRHQPADLLARHQWAAFARSLMAFDAALWVNHPWQTYRAESKPFQLRAAAKAGFLVPHTRVCNAPPPPGDAVWSGTRRCAVKAADTFLLRISEGGDAFFYTQLVTADELDSYSLAEMPVTIQELIEPKVDLRVTVVGDRVFPVSILAAGQGVVGDWRLQKTSVAYERYVLPESVRTACVQLVRDLGLVFGAVDLAVRKSDYYFLEVNPTGEWAWLVDQLGLPIAEVVVDALCAEKFRRLIDTFDPKSRDYWRHVGATFLGFLPEQQERAVRGVAERMPGLLQWVISVLSNQIVPFIPSLWFSCRLQPAIQEAKKDYEIPEHAIGCMSLSKEELKEAHKLELGRREQFNRKAQAYLLGVTVGTSFVIGMLNLSAKVHEAALGPSAASVVMRLTLAAIILSLFMSAMAAMRVIAPSEGFDLWLQERHTAPGDEMEKKQLIKLTLLNQAYNLIAANYLSTSYVGMRNGVVLVLCLLLWAIIAW